MIDCFKSSPAVVLLGPRQCGKSTLAKYVQKLLKGSIYLDLENYTDLVKLSDPLLFFEGHVDHLVIIDEVQLRPDLFPVLRTILDKNGNNGQLLLRGSASRDLIKQSSETLAGRILYLELTPFVVPELFPRSVLSASEKISSRG